MIFHDIAISCHLRLPRRLGRHSFPASSRAKARVTAEEKKCWNADSLSSRAPLASWPFLWAIWATRPGKRLHNYGKSPFFMGKSMKIHYFYGHGFNSKLLNYQRLHVLGRCLWIFMDFVMLISWVFTVMTQWWLLTFDLWWFEGEMWGVNRQSYGARIGQWWFILGNLMVHETSSFGFLPKKSRKSCGWIFNGYKMLWSHQWNDVDITGILKQLWFTANGDLCSKVKGV